MMIKPLHVNENKQLTEQFSSSVRCLPDQCTEFLTVIDLLYNQCVGHFCIALIFCLSYQIIFAKSLSFWPYTNLGLWSNDYDDES